MLRGTEKQAEELLVPFAYCAPQPVNLLDGISRRQLSFGEKCPVIFKTAMAQFMKLFDQLFNCQLLLGIS